MTCGNQVRKESIRFGGEMEGFHDPAIVAHHTELPETAFSRAVDPVLIAIGKHSSLVWPMLVAVITGNVLLRYVIGKGYIELEELQWHVYAVGFMLGLAWIIQLDEHVRIDVLADHFGFRCQCWIELVGLLLALLPFVGLIIWYSIPFIEYSFVIGEISEAPGGLSHRWAIKSVLLIGFVLVGLAALSRLTRVSAALFTSKQGVAR